MTVFVQDPDLTIHVGDVRDVLPTLEPESVDCVATSPPFYALRDYGVDHQIGLEATPDEWAAELVAVFRECRRILRPHGTLWVEVGDSYGRGRQGRDDNAVTNQGRDAGWIQHPEIGSRDRRAGGDIKDKDLVGSPWLLAFALRADGWYLRQCIVWSKPNAMPESVRDRCTTAHSYVFLLSKRPRYFFDADAIAEPAAWERWGDQTVPKHEGTQMSAGWIGARSKTEIHEFVRSRETREAQPGVKGFSSGTPNYTRLEGAKNARSVWAIPTRGYPGAHFATWPEALAERILLAGCPEKVCGTCGKPRERSVEQTPISEPTYVNNGSALSHGRGGQIQRFGDGVIRETVGWSDCGHNNYRPGIILDPFLGAGTTALVARRLGRRCIGVELNEEYARMAAERCSQLSLLA